MKSRMQERRDAGKKGCRNEGIQEMRDAQYLVLQLH